MRTDCSAISVSPDTSIIDALKVIDNGSLQIALVVDGDTRLVGTLTDGDVRRGLLRGVGLDQPVRSVMNGKPVTVKVHHDRDTTLKLMRSLVIHQIPVVDDAGRLAGLEWFDDLVKPHQDDTCVVLMAGGLGTRLRPLTDQMPKPMIPVGGRPLLETTVRNIASQGYRRFYLSVNYMADMIRDHFGDGSAFNVEIDYLFENKRLGTAGALSLLPKLPDGPIIVMNGDLLTSVSFTKLMDFHRQHDGQATMCVRDYNFTVPYGVAKVDGVKLIGVEEKPTQSFLINAGIYVLEPSVFQHIQADNFLDMPDLLKRVAAGGGDVTVFPVREYWLDIGRIEDLERARGEFLTVFDDI